MEVEKLTNAELKLMRIVWETKTISSGELVKKANSLLSWKKSTTYTILKKLSEKGMLTNEDSVVTYLISKEEFYESQKKDAIDRYFSGSLPQFLLAFIRKEKLGKAEIKELEKIIEEYKEEIDE